MPDDYDVGYGKPPRDGQFTKGQSGNPKGRPKGSRNMASILNEISCKPVTLTENGRSRTVPSKEAILLQLQSGAIKGDHRARRDDLQLLALAEAAELSEQPSGEPHGKEDVVFKGVLKRFQKFHELSTVGIENQSTVTSTPKEER